MAIFQHKKTEDPDGPLHFFDEYFREELRKRGREYFEKVINDDAMLFKKDLDEVVARANSALDEGITQRLDTAVNKVTGDMNQQFEERLATYGKSIQDAQDAALQALQNRDKELEAQHQELNESLKRSVAAQEKMLVDTYKENMAQITQMKEAQNLALQMLNRSAQALELQHQQLEQLLQKGIANQEAMVMEVFEQNMAKVVEHYLLGALGDQFDMKAQLPAIIKQMEDNKQAMVDDMKL